MNRSRGGRSSRAAHMAAGAVIIPGLSPEERLANFARATEAAEAMCHAIRQAVGEHQAGPDAHAVAALMRRMEAAAGEAAALLEG